MMRSLNSAVGGLRSHQTRMDVIGNNIANVNTYGFKSSRVTFSDVYYQTLSKGSAPTTLMGGTNPTQIGYGATVATIDVLNSIGSPTSTDRALDIYISGDGMIATKDADGNLRYSRLGILGFDAEGNLVDANGHFVMGFPMDRDGNPVINPDGSCDVDDLSKIQVDPEMLDNMVGISIGTTGDIVGILPGDTEVSVTKGLPPWISNMIVPEGSNLSGDIKIISEFRSESSDILNASWIKEVTALTNSGVEGTYSFSYTSNGRVIEAYNAATGELLSGTYTRGGIVELKDASGVVKMQIETDSLDQPNNDMTIGNMTFVKNQYICMDATDKGGTRVTDEVLYTVQGTVTLGSGTTQVTLVLDPANIDYHNEKVLDLNTAALPGWLKSTVMNTEANIPDTDVGFAYGIDYDATTNVGSPSYTNLNWMNSNAVKNLLNRLSNVNGFSGDYYIEIVEDTGAGTTPPTFNVNIFQDGTAAAVATGTVTSASTTCTITGTGAFASVTEDVFGGTFGGVPVTLASNTVLGNAQEYQYVRLYQNYTGGAPNANNMISEYKYSSGSTIRFTDFSFAVDGDALLADFADIKAGTMTNNQIFQLGTVRTARVEEWEYNNIAARATVGEGESVTIGVIAIAKVPNMEGMAQEGESYWSTTRNSGEATFGRPGTNNTGTFKAGYLEQSNVDISKEFTDMIITQRGFQANSRIVTVSDEMLQELVNLKR